MTDKIFKPLADIYDVMDKTWNKIAAGYHFNFTGLFDDKAYIKFDRTFFYQQMAQIEIAFRQNLNKTGKIKEN